MEATLLPNLNGRSIRCRARFCISNEVGRGLAILGAYFVAEFISVFALTMPRESGFSLLDATSSTSVCETSFTLKALFKSGLLRGLRTSVVDSLSTGT
eukprot:scaffold1535_cov382-Prasinococcus_capsulatus_cf.AAC.64